MLTPSKVCIELSEWVTAKLLFKNENGAPESIIKWGAVSSTFLVSFHLISLSSSNFLYLLKANKKINIKN